MKIAVFGASGRTGRPLVEQALVQGYEVTVLVRDPAKIQIKNSHLKLVQGNLIDPEEVRKVVAESEAVVSVIGPTKDAPNNFLNLAMANIIDAMNKEGVRRLISLTGAGVSDPLDQPKLVDRVFQLVLKLPIGGMRGLWQDSMKSVERIKASGLDWVIVRVPRLTQKTPKGSYRVGYVSSESGIKIARSDAADFILKQLTDDTYLHKLPVVSN